MEPVTQLMVRGVPPALAVVVPRARPAVPPTIELTPENAAGRATRALVPGFVRADVRG